jgi:hypothetical protein
MGMVVDKPLCKVFLPLFHHPGRLLDKQCRPDLFQKARNMSVKEMYRWHTRQMARPSGFSRIEASSARRKGFGL